jgi:hypothetical protein
VKLGCPVKKKKKKPTYDLKLCPRCSCEYLPGLLKIANEVIRDEIQTSIT